MKKLGIVQLRALAIMKMTGWGHADCARLAVEGVSDETLARMDSPARFDVSRLPVLKVKDEVFCMMTAVIGPGCCSSAALRLRVLSRSKDGDTYGVKVVESPLWWLGHFRGNDSCLMEKRYTGVRRETLFSPYVVGDPTELAAFDTLIRRRSGWGVQERQRRET